MKIGDLVAHGIGRFRVDWPCIWLAVKPLHSIDKNFESSWYALGELVVCRLEMNTWELSNVYL